MIGIYQIRNLETGLVYIGKSINLEKRRAHHFSVLRSNTHKNKNLQIDFNRRGEKAFVWEVLETHPKNSLQLMEVEKGYIIAAGNNCYNVMNQRSPRVNMRERIAAITRRGLEQAEISMARKETLTN